MLNFHRCFAPTTDSSEDTYLDNLELRSRQRALLTEARRLVRDKLRAALAKATAAFSGDEAPITCRFFTQGSWAYDTINRPCHIPPQQSDMDDGCYLPMGFVRGKSPRRAASWFFTIADAALEELVQQQGWKAYDRSKPTCCRIVIDAENHIDVPLYAIRDDMFVALKALGAQRAGRVLEALAYGEYEYELDWTAVTAEDVLLANRDGTWKASNPMEVCRWVKSEIVAKSEQIRRTWRYIKGFRDFQFQQGGSSSIALMTMIREDFSEIPRRDDLAVLAATKSVRQRVLLPIPAPWDKRDDLNRLNDADRQDMARRASKLEDVLEDCIQQPLAEAATCLRRLRAVLGPHFSQDVSRVSEVHAYETVRAYPAAPAVIPSFRGDNRSA